MKKFAYNLQNNKVTNGFNAILWAAVCMFPAYLLIEFLAATNLPYDASYLSYFSIAILDITFLGLPFLLLFLSLTYIGFRYLIKPTKTSMILFLMVFVLPTIILIGISIRAQHYYLLANDLAPLIGILIGFYIIKTNKQLSRNI